MMPIDDKNQKRIIYEKMNGLGKPVNNLKPINKTPQTNNAPSTQKSSGCSSCRRNKSK